VPINSIDRNLHQYSRKWNNFFHIWERLNIESMVALPKQCHRPGGSPDEANPHIPQRNALGADSFLDPSYKLHKCAQLDRANNDLLTEQKDEIDKGTAQRPNWYSGTESRFRRHPSISRHLELRVAGDRTIPDGVRQEVR
jgi:hypothetical protein